jgi:TolB-like protein
MWRRGRVAYGGALAAVGILGLSRSTLATSPPPAESNAFAAPICRPLTDEPRRELGSLTDVGSIGIAYFAGRSRGGDDAHLAAALTTELATQLLSARPKSSSRKAADSGHLLVVKLSEGGGFSDVDLSMTGSVFRDETGVRTTVKLTRTSDGSVVWSGTKARPLLELPILARLIAQEVAIRIGAQLVAPRPKAANERSPEVYELLLRGQYIPSRYDPDDLLSAIEYFDKALRLDPKSTRARELLRTARLRLVAWGGTGGPLESRLLAEGALGHIQERALDESERLVEEADEEMRDGVPIHACQLLNEAIDRDARSAPAYALRSLIQARGGNVRAAFSDAEVVKQLGRPVWGNSLRVVALRRTGDTTSARREMRGLLAEARRRTGPLPFWDARFMATMLVEMSDSVGARSMLRRIDPRDPRLPWLQRDSSLVSTPTPHLRRRSR